MEFLKAVTVQQALALILTTPVKPAMEMTGLDEASGRVVAEDILSTEAILGFSRFLVDGYAVIAKDTQGARETSPAFLKVSGEVRIGDVARVRVAEGSSVLVSTGSMIPEGADSVVMQEYVRALEGEVEVTRPVYKGENIIHTGEDVGEGSVVIARGKRIGPFDLGVLAAVGAAGVKVFSRPRVALLSSGDEIVPVEERPPFGTVRDINRHTVAALLRASGADVTFTGLAREAEGYTQGEEVPCELLRAEGEIAARIHIIGSHDLSLDVARDIVKARHPEVDLISTHTGSLSGILAVKAGVTGFATTHILDDDGRTYNIPVIRKYLSEVPLQLIHVVKRQQGILVKRGNPLSIRGISDLARPGIKFVNRQFGSGTRILFDIMLAKEGVEKRAISGYDREESSHTAVGILVKESIADAGIGIYSVARAFSLDFIPLAEEDYDLIVTEDFAGDERFQILMDTLVSREFRGRLEDMGGYNTVGSGKVKYVISPAGKAAS